MSNLAMCRVCLTTNVRMHEIIGSPLQEIFEKLTNISLTNEEGKPVLACYICRYRLLKCLKLMTTATRANEFLTRLLLSGVVLTQSAVAASDQACRFEGGLCISPTENITVIEADDFNTAVNIGNVIKHDAPPVKSENVETDEPNDGKEGSQSDHNTDLETNDQSDPEDDVPLKSISMKQQSEGKKRCVTGRQRRPERKKCRDFVADFAREIILTKEEQFEELLERSKSINYLNSPLKCEICYKGFVDARAYDNHKEKHDEKSGLHECSVCRTRHLTARQLRTHAAAAHTRRYACHQCGHRSHTAHQAREHEKWHRGHTYECKLCGQTFRKPTSYLTHKRKQHPTQHICDICGHSFVGRHGLLMHKGKAHHREQPLTNPMEPASKRFCGECNVQFLSVDAWVRHVLSSDRHALGDGDSGPCRVCGCAHPAGGLRAHLRGHERAGRAHPPPPARPAAAHLPCEQCGASFVNRSKLRAHVKTVHMGLKYNKNIVCEVCGKKCTSNASLRYHQRTHTGEKPYQCGACPKRFSDNNQLRIHTRTHTGERPYCCAACGKRFSQKPALNRHYRVHTGAKPYTCQFCSKTFSQSNSLKLHVRAVHLKMPPNKRSKTQHVSLDSVVLEKVEETVTLQAL